MAFAIVAIAASYSIALLRLRPLFFPALSFLELIYREAVTW
jgi:hypothetical protein